MWFLKHDLVFFSSIQNSLLCLSLIATAASTDVPKKNPFSWKAGTWGECISSECGSAGLQVRPVWCVHSEGWSTHQSNCHLWKRPALQRTCARVCEWQRQLFEWQPSAWGPCSPAPSLASEQCVTAQRGLQRRTATCVLRLNGTDVSSHVCQAFSPTPELERACLLPCPLDCVVSTFSHWSPCSRTCAPALQHRTRQVLAPPLYGGDACPSLTQVRPCSQNTAQCPYEQHKHSYSLWAGPWSPCRRKGAMPSGRTMVDFSNNPSRHIVLKSSHTIMGNIHSQHHHHDHHRGLKPSWEIHIGYQTHQVRCTKSDGKNALLSLCDHAGTPVNFRSCVMPRDCDVSAWSEWSPCSKTCRSTDQSPGFRSRKRSVRTVPIAGGEECPALEEVETCNTLEDLLPHCPRYDWKVTNWGSCQVKLLISQQDHRHGNSSFLCGGGIQTREAYCVRIFDNATKSHVCRPVGQNLCSNLPPPSLIQFCSIPCSKPCHLSSWSPWGPCIHDNTIEHPGTKGFKFRMRFIVEEPWGESESCPHVSEAMTCDHPVSFLWRVTSQGPCLPHDRACGRGVQEQTVECVTVTGDTVPIEQCPGDRPPVREPCQMPCPDDCVLGEWSSWSSCSHCCSGKQAQGKQTRSRLILAPPGEQGKGCLPAPVLEQWRACGTQAYTVNYWDTSPWGPCTPDSGTDRNSTEQEETEEKACGTGIQTRRVACRRADGGGGVESNSCPESTRPDPWRSCVLPCKVDCIVTPFSKWSPCPTSCSPTNSSVSTQSRHRIIIQRPDNGGQECPATLYEERECDPRPLCPTYRWQTHRWHQCILVPDSVRQAAGSPSETCGLGLQTRAVTCVRADDAPADMAECVRWAGPMPDAVQQCGVACKDDCIFSSWSKFSQCDGCGGSRTRTRSLIGRSKKWWRCQQETLVEKEACPCSNYHIQGHGPWSPCILPELHQHAGYLFTKRGSHLVQGITRTWRIHGEGKECGHGWRYRALACLDHHERLVNPALCNSSGVEEEKCAVPCPLNCRLSEWSAWSSCSAPCGGGVKVRARWLREKPFNGGRPCPKLNVKNQAQVSEVVPCYSECNQYIWEAEPWSMCVVGITSPTRPSCGEGVQTRKIRCVRKEEDRRSGMNDTLCSRDDRPIAVQSCLVPCPGQCVTSEWSSWSECSMGCNEKELRWRSKTIVRMPGKGHTCPELNQTQTCANTSCLSYSYAYSDWSSCRLSDNAVCGQGTKTRLLNCVDSDGKLVELGMCKEWGPSRGKLSAPCEVSCPVDCLLSDWSLWSQCSHTCGAQSQMTRSRLVLHQAGEGGRPCPSQLSQTKPCPIRPCYSWTLGDWNSCKVEGAECGDGMRERNVSCVVHWGSLSAPPFPKAVTEEQCVENGLHKATEAERRHLCYVPCPGDCHLTDWSPWSVCQLLCLDGRSFETWGHQARSRAVIIQVPENKASCPSQVYETRPCQRGTCLSYEWVTGEWRENQRAVWCRRSDGVNVTGGCFAQTKPSGVHQCSPPCTKPFSYCTQSETCGCEKGFTEVMTSNGFLDYCTKSPGTDNKKANVKRSGGRLRRTHQQNESRAWTLQPLGPDGRVRLWVYGLMAGGFIMILLIIAMSFLLCKNPKDDPNSCKTQRAVSLAYDGDADM